MPLLKVDVRPVKDCNIVVKGDSNNSAIHGVEYGSAAGGVDGGPDRTVRTPASAAPSTTGKKSGKRGVNNFLLM